jgi:hypothetical protein
MMEQVFRRTIILAGSGRSGTTWLGNILAAQPTIRIIFEPLDYRRVPEAAVFPLRPYARPQGDYPLWQPVVDQILRGEVHNDWVDREQSKWWPKFATTWRLIKEIRANLMLGWMSEQFGCPIVYVTRHPCAVVYSRLKLGWKTHLDTFTAQPELVADYLTPTMDLILGAETAVERHAVMWCVENLVPLRQMADYDWQFCTYEALCQRPAFEANRLLSSLGLPYNWLARRAVHRISSVARADSAVVGTADPLRDWQYKMETADIDATLNIVDAFGIDMYTADPLPHLDRIGRPQPTPAP